MFHYAASYFGDADAQYSLARLYLDGTAARRIRGRRRAGSTSRPRRATRPSQALLGHMLVTGQGVAYATSQSSAASCCSTTGNSR